METKEKKSVPERIHHRDLPEGILVTYESTVLPKKGENVDLCETYSGSSLLKKMAEIWLSAPEMDVSAQKYEKPKAFINGEEISVSFSHTNEALSAALSNRFTVGCDMESIGRAVNPRLIQRMMQPDEDESLYETLDPIRIWTFKESALKMIGTGLRKPMNSVKIEQEDASVFRVKFDDGNRAKICSFQYKSYWISICYQE